MDRSLKTWQRLGLIVTTFVVVSLAGTLYAADNDTGPPEPINCGDEGTRQACIECDAGGPLGCCDYDDMGNPTCPIVNDPPTTAFTGGNIAIKIGDAGLKLKLTRKAIVKNGELFVKLQLKQSFVSPNVNKTVAFKATVAGNDASTGSLAYAVGFTGMGAGALGALQGQGKILSVEHAGVPRTCQDSFGPTECAALATQLAKAIDGALLPGNGSERSEFLQLVGSLGYPPCQLIC